MKEIYLLTRLSELSHVLEILEVVCVIVIAVIFSGVIINYSCDGKSDLPGWAKKWVPATIAVLSVALVLDFFIPNRNDMLLIYGLGGTIDYVQSNDKAKQLPDKAVEALNRYLDTINEDKCSEEKMEGKRCQR
jgi:hypothetical protein